MKLNALLSRRTANAVLPDVVIVGVIFLIVVMLLTPLSTTAVDIFVFFSISLSVITLMMTIYVEDAVAFSTYPVLLLILAIWRISLSVATTRNILVDGDAGEIITAFGEVAISGNVIVGVVIFFLITIVQFVVINKGSERVAEVGARFTLDSLPGKQMSIDADLRAGSIDGAKAKAMRAYLQQESQFHGAMDGSMKFLKGDAIAGLLMVFVNFLGGVLIGTVQNGLPLGEVIQKYTILTIGDALVGQIPAIFTAVSAGILVTRIPGAHDSDGDEPAPGLSQAIIGQFLKYSKSFLTSGVIITCIAFFPGFPTALCLCYAVACFGGYFLVQKYGSRADSHNQKTEMIDARLPALSILLSPDLRTLVDGKKEFEVAVRDAMVRTASHCGVAFPRAEIVTDPELTGTSYIFSLGNTPIAGGTVEPTRCYAVNCERILGLCNVSFETIQIADDASSYFAIEPPGAPLLRRFGATVLDPANFLLHRMSLLMLAATANFIDLEVVRRRLSAYSKKSPEGAKELQKLIQPPQINEVLRRLAAEQVPIGEMHGVLDKLLSIAQREKEVNALVRQMRVALMDCITFNWLCDDGRIYCIQLAGPLQGFLLESLRETPQGEFLAIGLDEARAIAESIGDALKRWELEVGKLVLLVPGEIRAAIRRLMEFSFPHLPVIAIEEIRRDIAVEIFHVIDTSENMLTSEMS